MIALYIVSIVVVCGLLVFYFFWTAKKHKKHLEGLKLKQEDDHQSKMIEEQVESDLKKAEKEVLEEEGKIEVELENFDWNSGETLEQKASNEDEFEGEFDQLFDESLFDSKIESYERFLREEGDSFDLDREITNEEENDVDEIMSFDFDSLKGKTREQVVDMIKDLSPTVQDFILNDIFDRKNGD